MAKKKSLLKLQKGLDLNHTAHSGTHMPNILFTTHGNHHSLGDSAVGVVEKSGHWKLAELGWPSPQLNRWPWTRFDPASVSMKWKLRCFPTNVADRMTVCARLVRLAVSGHLTHNGSINDQPIFPYPRASQPQCDHHLGHFSKGRFSDLFSRNSNSVELKKKKEEVWESTYKTNSKVFMLLIHRPYFEKHCPIISEN